MVAADGVSAMVPFINSNQIKLVAVTSEARAPQFPNTPTVSETIPNFLAVGEFGFVGPAKMAPEHIRILTNPITEAIHSPEVRDKLPGLGLTPVTQSPEFFEQVFAKQYERFGNIVKAIGYQPK